MNSTFTLRLLSLLYLLVFSHTSLIAAQLIVGNQSYNSTFGSGGFTTVSLTPNFAQPPVVFVLPTIQGGDPANVRVRNITAANFQAAPTEPHRQDGPHLAMQSTSISVDKGNYELPDGTKFKLARLIRLFNSLEQGMRTYY